jgi:NADP-dependent 3-hydroxy acid dehydrogenase YdfG
MKTILITGAASGIGKATAELFSQKGWNVAATMRDIEQAKQFKDFKNIHCYVMDVVDVLSVEGCVEQIIRELGTIDALLNNAGVYETDPLEGVAFENIDRMIKTNVYGVVNVTKSVLPHFRERKQGMIVNISSIAGRATFPFQSIYHLTKWAVEGFSEGLRYELKNLNIKVKSIAPGSVKTNLWKDLDGQAFEKYPKEYQTNFKSWFSYLKGNIEKGFSPAHEASIIYKAVCDNKDKFRYSSDANTKLAVLLHSVLPLNTFQSFISKEAKLTTMN